MTNQEGQQTRVVLGEMNHLIGTTGRKEKLVEETHRVRQFQHRTSRDQRLLMIVLYADVDNMNRSIQFSTFSKKVWNDNFGLANKGKSSDFGKMVKLRRDAESKVNHAG